MAGGLYPIQAEEVISKAFQRAGKERRVPRILDVGSGSGCWYDNCCVKAPCPPDVLVGRSKWPRNSRRLRCLVLTLKKAGLRMFSVSGKELLSDAWLCQICTSKLQVGSDLLCARSPTDYFFRFRKANAMIALDDYVGQFDVIQCRSVAKHVRLWTFKDSAYEQSF